MNFYAAQDKARKKTKWLILIYLLILCLITLLSSWVLMLLVPLFTQQSINLSHLFNVHPMQNLPIFLGVGGFVMGGALISSYVKSRALAKGGASIAASLGGIRIAPNSSDLNERKALNVVEEMAIASGMPVPEVFVLKQEQAINAFAAGQSASDAVIGLTAGAIQQLSRAQLQGVVGHEFSHILNGDMRLNLRIIMLLYGIEFVGIVGRIFTQSTRGANRTSSRKGKGNGLFMLVGVLLRLIGWFGVLFGKIIKAAISRQREFLADASSVQFTRNPMAVADALKVIGYGHPGTVLTKTDTSEVSHLFFGQVFQTHFNFLFATHPPLAERIKSIDPSWDGQFVKPLPLMVAETPEAMNAETPNALGGFLDKLPEPLAMLMAAGVAIGPLDSTHQQQLLALTEKANDPLDAMGLVVAVLASDGNVPQAAYESLQNVLLAHEVAGLAQSSLKSLQLLDDIGLENRIPLVELAMPALKNLSLAQYESFNQLLLAVIDLDQQQTIYERSIYQLVTHYLQVHFGLAKPSRNKYKKPKQIAIELQMLLSMLAYYGHDAQQTITVQLAFKRAMQSLGFDLIEMAPVAEYQSEEFKNITEKLADCSFELKDQIVQALVICVEHDGQIKPVERELILAIAATMDAPIPRLSL